MKCLRINKKPHNGFTLVELSIVTVLIGLLLAAVSYGSAVVKSSKIKALSQQISLYNGVIQQFSDEYNALPGDFSDAEKYLGCTGCNGNGDNVIDYPGGTVGEAWQAWNHLRLAELIVGPYTGAKPTNNRSRIGIDVPESIWPNAGFELAHDTSNSKINVENNVATSTMQIAGEVAVSMLKGLIISPQDLWSLDTLIDDGLCDSTDSDNFIFGLDNATSPLCCDTTSSPNTYNITNKGERCYIAYRLVIE